MSSHNSAYIQYPFGIICMSLGIFLDIVLTLKNVNVQEISNLMHVYKGENMVQILQMIYFKNKNFSP